MNSARLAVVVSAVAVGALTGCGSPAGPAAGGATHSAQASASGAASATATASPSGAVGATTPSAAAFAPIVEPFDPGHPARSVASPASCAGQDTTLAIEQCYEDKTETADAAIDAVRQASYQSGSAAQRAAINAADGAWLAARRTVCDKAYQTGGTIDGINIASCLFDESTARLNALRGITLPEAVLKSTDSTSLSDLSWYTTPEGSRIAMIDTQGDSSGGAVIAWVIIAGADGFGVNPAQFYYSDGAFTDHGIIQAPDPAGHPVTPGAVYQFSIDYSHLKADPNAGKGSGGWVYAPDTPVAVWR
jgi:uncharacterized protein YecT (DUF1311 family)